MPKLAGKCPVTDCRVSSRWEGGGGGGAHGSRPRQGDLIGNILGGGGGGGGGGGVGSVWGRS